MINGLHRPGLAIAIGGNWAQWDANFLYGPKDYPHPFLRIFVHEVLHFWQTLGQGFFARVALAEWNQLLAFEASKETDLTIADEVRERSLLLHREAAIPGISAWSLSESLCRFWDMHIMGPERLISEAPELQHLQPQLMREGYYRETENGREYSGAAFELILTIQDSYAAPYRIVMERLGSRKAVLYFPLAAHFALQTPDPAAVFLAAIQQFENFPDPPPGFVINYQWPEDRDRVHKVCQELCAKLCNGALLETGLDVIRATDLKRNPIYAHFAALANMIEDAPWYGHGLAFTLPGQPDDRKRMTDAFLPPLVLFDDGRWSETSSLHAQGKLVAALDLAVNLADMQDAAELSQLSEQLLMRHRRFAKARQLKAMHDRAHGH